jgi:hypothetical protein
MIIENLELDDREAAQAELEELAGILREGGLTVEVAPLDAPSSWRSRRRA